MDVVNTLRSLGLPGLSIFRGQQVDNDRRGVGRIVQTISFKRTAAINSAFKGLAVFKNKSIFAASGYDLLHSGDFICNVRTIGNRYITGTRDIDSEIGTYLREIKGVGKVLGRSFFGFFHNIKYIDSLRGTGQHFGGRGEQVPNNIFNIFVFYISQKALEVIEYLVAPPSVPEPVDIGSHGP